MAIRDCCRTYLLYECKTLLVDGSEDECPTCKQLWVYDGESWNQMETLNSTDIGVV